VPAQARPVSAQASLYQAQPADQGTQGTESQGDASATPSSDGQAAPAPAAGDSTAVQTDSFSQSGPGDEADSDQGKDAPKTSQPDGDPGPAAKGKADHGKGEEDKHSDGGSKHDH
jgi:hypothetical protein